MSGYLILSGDSRNRALLLLSLPSWPCRLDTGVQFSFLMRTVCRTSDLKQEDYFKLVSVLEAGEGRPFVFSEQMLLLVHENQVRKDVSLGEDPWFVSLMLHHRSMVLWGLRTLAGQPPPSALII